jgi:hypothetical protein
MEWMPCYDMPVVREVMAMPIKVVFSDDVFVLADTPEQAIALVKLHKNGASSKPGPTEEECVRAFSYEINENAKKFLVALLGYPAGVKGEEFTEATTFKPEKFGGILGGASKIAKKHGLKFEQFVSSEMRSDESRRYRFLAPGVLLSKYAALFAKRGKTSVAP